MSSAVETTSWIEISKKALFKNLSLIKKTIGLDPTLLLCVKANAYGHGDELITNCIQGHDSKVWFGVHSLEEVRRLRSNGITHPLYIMGPTLLSDMKDIIELDARCVIYDYEHLAEAQKQAEAMNKTARLHIKIETGNNRQGISTLDAARLCRAAQGMKNIMIEGLSTHFANIEDIQARGFFNTHLLKTKFGSNMSQYPQKQLLRFKETIAELENQGHHFEKIHCANSAATLLFPETHFSMVRPGLILYGLWPSTEVKNEFEKRSRTIYNLEPVLTWKTRVGHLKNLSKGEPIGYGCTYKTKRDTKIAVLPIGYFDGYDRGLSNKGHVMIHDQAAPVRGRVCMNMIMVDVTDIPNVKHEDTVTLIGDGMSADEMAKNAGTINYEITTRIREGITRLSVE